MSKPKKFRRRPNKLLYSNFPKNDIMRHKKNCALMGRHSQAVQDNVRLATALAYGPIRSTENFVVFEIRTRNPRTGQEHFLEIKHEISNGTNRYSAYLDGDKSRDQWSRTAFCRWLFGKIDSVLVR